MKYELSETPLTVRTERTESAQVTLCQTDFLKPVISLQTIPWFIIWYDTMCGGLGKKSAYIMLGRLDFKTVQIFIHSFFY